MVALSKEGLTASYTYDESGLRTSKTVNGITTEYYWNGSILLAQKTGDSCLHFLYDEDGALVGFNNETKTYIYTRNAQGDIISITDTSNGNTVAQYTYDSWGNILTATGTMAEVNPFRYRGYYYDSETGLYYLQSRYYDAEVGRFIEADAYIATGQDITGNNMYIYCGNNPIVRIDESGEFWKEIAGFFKGVGEAIVSGIEKLGNAIEGSFQIEAGFGYGIGVSGSVGPVRLSAEAYQDSITIGYKNGHSYSAIRGSAGVSAQVSKKFSLGISTEYEHRYETDAFQDWDEHTSSAAPWDVYNCPKTVKDPIQVSIPIVKPIEGTLSDSVFVGINMGAHLGIGGHFIFGWDLKEFWRILRE